MTLSSRVPKEWQAWILENLARGCTTDMLVQAMVERSFEKSVAEAAIAELSAPAPVPATATASQPEDTPRIQASGRVIRTSDRDVHVLVRSVKPVIVVLDDLLSVQECDEMLRLAQSKTVLRSTVVDPATGSGTVDDVRTSSGTFFQRGETDLITRIERRLAEVMNLPVEHGESIQILRYQAGGEYKPHYDYFPPESPGSQKHLVSGGQRVSTMIMYLSDVEAGGETIFPQVSLSVSPKKGAAVYFESCNSQGDVDPLTLHGGAPVEQGEKWIATKWVRQRPWQ